MHVKRWTQATSQENKSLQFCPPSRSGVLSPGGPRNPEAVLTYNVTYKCDHCGKEWSKIETENVEIPEEYSESGFD